MLLSSVTMQLPVSVVLYSHNVRYSKTGVSSLACRLTLGQGALTMFPLVVKTARVREDTPTTAISAESVVDGFRWVTGPASG